MKPHKQSDPEYNLNRLNYIYYTTAQSTFALW